MPSSLAKDIGIYNSNYESGVSARKRPKRRRGDGDAVMSVKAPDDGYEAEVILVSPSFEDSVYQSSVADTDAEQKMTDLSPYPMSLGYLHAVLEAEGIPTRTYWLSYSSFDRCFQTVMEAVRKKSVRVLGLQMLTVNRVAGYRLIEKVHEERPDVDIVIGGIHATVMHEQLLTRYPFITVVLGEAEETLPELVKVFSSGGDVGSVSGIAYSVNGKVIKTKSRELLQDLDSLPFPKHDLFMSPGRTMMCAITSRGCPFNCSFCCLGPISQRKVRFRSVTKVIDEIEDAVKAFPQIKQVWLHDDSFFLDNERVIRFCDEVTSRGIKLDFLCSGRMKPIMPEMVKKLEEANFTKVYLGLESGDNGILRRCRKAITQKDVTEAFEKFKGSKTELGVLLIVGLPGETEQTLMETARFVKSIQRIKYVYFHEIGILKIYPGSEVYELEKATGMIDDSYWLTDGPVPFYTVEHTEKELRAYMKTLLDHISADRLLTPEGICKQLPFSLPIMRYLFSNPNRVVIAKSIGGSAVHSVMTSDGR